MDISKLNWMGGIHNEGSADRIDNNIYMRDMVRYSSYFVLMILGIILFNVFGG